MNRLSGPEIQQPFPMTDNGLRTEVEFGTAGDAKKLDHVRLRRDRQALKTAGAGILSLGLGYAIRLAVIPLSLKLLGTERYGLWLAVGSLVALGGLADLGFSPGLVNVVAAASGRGDKEAMRRRISTAFAAYAALAGILALVVLLTSQWAGLPRLLGATNARLAHETRLLVAVCGTLFAAGSLARVVTTACTALQEGYFASWAYVAGSLGSLALLAPLVWWHGSLLAYALIMGLPVLVAHVAIGAIFFGQRHPDLRPGLQWCDAASLRDLWDVAGPVTLQQLGNLTVSYSANVLIANRLGPAAVPQYSIPYALFAILVSIAWQIVSSYLPAYAEASAREDWQWIRRRAMHALWVTVALLGSGGAALLLAGPETIRLWTGGQVKTETGLLATLACFCLLKAVSNANGTLLVGLRLVKMAAFVSVTVGVVYVVGAWFLLPWLGLVAVPVAGVLAYLLDTAVSLPYALRRIRAGDASVCGLSHANMLDVDLPARASAADLG
jgi:O-antigen/teichoic acid export membrane protein